MYIDVRLWPIYPYNLSSSYYIHRTYAAHIERRGKLDVSVMLRKRKKSMSHIHSCTYMLHSNYASVLVGIRLLKRVKKTIGRERGSDI
jgi:hypothetical protein